MYSKIKVTDYLEKEGVEIAPTIYAHALPGGAVKFEDFMSLATELVDAIPNDIDGVWLYLHGSMYVEKIGSGDEYLVQMVRDKVGKDVPISLALDFHANNTDKLVSMVNFITGFRTAPHRDHTATQLRAAEKLLYCLRKGIMPTPVIERANVVICGDAVQTDLQPLKSVMEMAEELEKSTEGILGVQVFNGQPWIDEPYMGPNFVVTHENNVEIAKEIAKKLSVCVQKRNALKKA
jgi:microcystin degradation protein MlrC